MTKPFDVDFARAQFPDSCFDWAFFENAGGSFVPNSVIKHMTAYMTDCQVQPGAPFPRSAEAQARMDAAHARMAEFIGAEKDEVAITAATSVNAYVLMHALRPLMSQGDEVIVTDLAHEANASPWRRLEEFGITVKTWPITAETGELELEALKGLLTDRTKLVAFPHVSNVTGDINDVSTITKICHDAGAMVCVDGVAFAPHRAVDVKTWDVDFYIFSYYKVFGPHLGCFYGKRERLLEAKSQYHYFYKETDIPGKLNPGGPNHESIASLMGVADYFEALASHHFDQPKNTFQARVQDVYGLAGKHEEALAAPFVDFALNHPRIRLLGRQTADEAQRAATFSITVDGKRSEDICRAVEADKVAIRNGHFYAPKVLEATGVTDLEDGVIRCSMAHYNTLEEVDRLIRALDKAC